MNALEWAILLAVTLPRTGDKPTKILLPADASVWVCAQYEHGRSCKTVGAVRDFILADPENGLE